MLALLINRYLTIYRIPLGYICQLIRQRLTTILIGLLRSEQRPEGAVTKDRLIVRLLPSLRQWKAWKERLHLLQHRISHQQFDDLVGANARYNQMNTGLCVVLPKIVCRVHLLHHIYICDLLDIHVLRHLRHVSPNEVGRILLSVEVLCVLSFVDEVQIHAERTNASHLLKHGDATISSVDILAIYTVELGKICVRNLVERTVKSELVRLLSTSALNTTGREERQ